MIEFRSLRIAIYLSLFYGADAALFPAHAYLDPGTGTMLLQGMIAAFSGGAALIVAKYSQIRAFFAKRMSNRDPGAR